MGRELAWTLATALALQVIAAHVTCPNDPNCVCGGTLALELNCNVDGRTVEINLLPNTYINIKCVNATSLDYTKLPKCANKDDMFKSVSFKDCPLPSSSFKDVLNNIGVSKTMALIFQNKKNLSGYFDRKHFAGLQNLTKLLLSVNGITHLPDNLFMDINKLTWLNIRSNSINLSEGLFKPLERLETLEISHNHMTNISSNLFAHLSYLRKLSLWQSNVTWFSKDFFTGVDVLEELDLSSNGLNELPASIFKPLRKLKKLTLFSNKFSTLPQNLFESNEELETVIILNNDVELRNLPRNLFGNLPNLKQIYIQRCGLEIIPYDIFANSPQITNLSLAYNDINALPESVFNDQINLLELDLCHNKLMDLEPKLFSSLVRLERLNLCHNSLVRISGSTFSPLLSLLDLNMEHNNLKTISSYLFSNNRQRMSLSLAYNELDFEHNGVQNGASIETRVSPFSHTYNLRLLNLSHNKFQRTFDDWWINGHESLDISYNKISYFWGDGQSSLSHDYKKMFKKRKSSLQELWISHNNFQCKSTNDEFLNFLKYHLKTKVIDLKNLDCPIWADGSSTMLIILWIANIIFVILIVMVIILCVSDNLQKRFYSTIKKILHTSHEKNKANESHGIIIKYSENDEEFIFKEVLPDLENRLAGIEIHTNPICKSQKTLTIPMNEAFTTIVMFTPNYLTSNYSHVNIKQIKSEMFKATNTIYIFVDVGPENSIYAFLKEQRDRRSTVVWNDKNFWKRLMKILVKGERNEKRRVMGKLFQENNKKIASAKSTLTPYDSPNLYAFDTFTHIQV